MSVKYAIIGCGAIGQRRHIPECVANPRSKLAALVDANEARVGELGRKYGAPAFTDHRTMLEEARAGGADLPLAARVLEVYDGASAEGWGERDAAALPSYWPGKAAGPQGA